MQPNLCFKGSKLESKKAKIELGEKVLMNISMKWIKILGKRELWKTLE